MPLIHLSQLRPWPSNHLPPPSPAGCTLSFKEYPYEPEGECLGTDEPVKQWGMIDSNRCCRTALIAYSQALARHALQNDTIFLNKDQWPKCELPAPDKKHTSIDECRLKDLHQENDRPCSTLTRSELATKYPRQYQNLIGNCSQFDDPSFDETCHLCTQEIKSARTQLLGQLGLKDDDADNRPICGVALVILIAAAKIDNATWVSDFFRCLPALDIVGKTISILL